MWALFLVPGITIAVLAVIWIGIEALFVVALVALAFVLWSGLTSWW